MSLFHINIHFTIEHITLKLKCHIPSTFTKFFQTSLQPTMLNLPSPSHPKPKPSSKPSPSSQSKPIRIPNQARPRISFTQTWRPVPARIHHRLDNVTDYHCAGSRGWEHAHQYRLDAGEKDVGRILGGRWPPKRVGVRQGVVMWDVDFEGGVGDVDDGEEAYGEQEEAGEEKEEVDFEMVEMSEVTKEEARREAVLERTFKVDRPVGGRKCEVEVVASSFGSRDFEDWGKR